MVVSVMGGRTIKVSDKLFAELKRTKGNLSFNKYVKWLLVREKERLGERDEEKYPVLVVDWDDYEALGRAGVPTWIKHNQKRRTDKYGVPLSEGYQG
jgi:hypothetical protein